MCPHSRAGNCTCNRFARSPPVAKGAPARGYQMRATPDFDFGLSDEAEMIRDTVARFADERIDPLAAAIDREDRFPRELWTEMGELGLHGITVPEADGGLGLGYLEHVLALEEVSRASASVGLSYGAHS